MVTDPGELPLPLTMTCGLCTIVGCEDNLYVREYYYTNWNKESQNHHRPKVGGWSRFPVQCTSGKIFC